MIWGWPRSAKNFRLSAALPPFQLAMMTSRAEALPRTLERAVDQVVFVDGVMVRVEHVGPDDDPGLRVDRFEDRRASACILGQELAGRQLAALTGQAPVGHSDFVVRHEERLGVKQLIEPPGLVDEDFLDLGLAQTTHDLEAVRDHGVIPAHAEAVSVLDPRTRRDPDRRPGWSNSYSPS